jgi:glutamine amidotransferase
MIKVAVIDYGNGNLGSLLSALKRLPVWAQVWQNRIDVEPVDAIIFPGVGALGSVIQHLEFSGIRPILERHAERSHPVLGICLGMQLFFEEGAEGGSGLGWIAGSVPALRGRVLPHIGWNTVSYSQGADNGTKDPAYYFVHTYRVLPTDPDVVVGTTEYDGETFPSIVRTPFLYGVQFHPELSGATGHRLLSQWLREVL